MATVYRQGRQVINPEEAVRLIMDGCWLYWNGRPVSPAFMQNQMILTLNRATKAGQLFIAERNE